MKFQPILYLLALSLATLSSALAGTFSTDFNGGEDPPNGTELHSVGGGGVIEPFGGVNDSGVLKLTKAVNNQTGSFIVDDLDNGAPVNGFTATWKMRVGGGSATPADGFSFCVAPDLPSATWGEEGEGFGLRVAFDIYDNGGGEAPAVDVYWNGAVVRSLKVPIATLMTGADFVDVVVKLDSDGSLDIIYNGQELYTNYHVPGFQPIEGARYGWGARTGGLNTNQFIDDISLVTTTGPLQPAVVTHPASIAVLQGYPAQFFVTVNDLDNSTIQWERQPAGGGGFTPVPGANDWFLITGATSAADNGAQYRVAVTLNGTTVTSEPATLEVVTLPAPAPKVAYDFNDGAVPANTEVYGSANVQAFGGVNNSGFLELTPAANNLIGNWIVPDLDSGSAVDGFYVSFKLNMTPDPGVTPADGVGFHFAPNLPDDAFGTAEEPVGDGLSVTFDVYNNGGGEAPAIDLFWLGQRVGGVAVPIEFLNTEGQFANVIIRLEPDGTVDVAYNGILVIHNVAVPGWSAMSGGKFGFAGRTGGLNQFQAIDDVTIATSLYTGPVQIAEQPASATVLVGNTATFRVVSNDPARSSYQWQRAATADGPFTDIPGATAASYTTPPAAFPGDHQTAYRVVVRSTNGTTTTSETAILTVLNIAPPASPQVLFTFDDGAVTNTGSKAGVIAEAFGTAGELITLDGGVNDSGVLHLTDPFENQNGSLIIEDFNDGANVGGFTAAFHVRSGGGSAVPADGWSFSWGRGIPMQQATGELENGLGNDLRVAFDIYDNDDANPNNEAGEAPAIEVYWQGAMLARARVPLSLLDTGDDFEQVIIQLTQDGKVTVAHSGVVVLVDVQIPNFAGVGGANFALAGRTGGAYTNQWVDNFALSTTLYVGPLTFVAQPVAGATILENSAVTLSAEVNDPARATYQWQRKAPGDADFSNIPGANAAEYTTPPLTLADNGVQYRLVATATTNTVASEAATISVVSLGLPSQWTRIIDFNDGQLPLDGYQNGSAFILPDGGVGGTGHMELTSPAGSLYGSFTLDDQNAGAPVSSMTAEFYFRVAEPSSPPADGFSFCWGRNLPLDGTFGEDGAGDDLIVSFDTYDNVDANPYNGVGEAPAIRLMWRGTPLGSVMVPLDLFLNDGEFAQALVRVNSDGTCDVVYNNFVAFWKQPLPGWNGALANARYGWGARTGGAWALQALDEVRILTETSAAGPQPTISAVVSGANLVITFQGTLQTSTTLSNWTNVPGAVSPLTIPLNTLNAEPRRFWRAVR